jgi:hypothetical protein
MPKALAPDKRERILADIRAGDKSRNQIARDHHVAASTVGNIATQAGLAEAAFDRTHTVKGARAKAADNKARRAQLASDLLEDAQHFRKRCRSAYQVVTSSAEGAEIVTLDEPPLPDVRAAYTAIGIAVDKGIAIEKHDVSDDAAAAQRSLLGQLFAGLTQAVGEDAPGTSQDEA